MGVAAGPGGRGATVCEGDRAEGGAGPGGGGARGRWTVENCGGGGGGGGGGAALGVAAGFPATGDVGGARGAAGSCGRYLSSISAIAASSAVSSRVMSLSGSGGRKLLSWSSRALRARS